MGTTSYDDGAFRVETSDTHSLQSQFSWARLFRFRISCPWIRLYSSRPASPGALPS